MVVGGSCGVVGCSGAAACGGGASGSSCGGAAAAIASGWCAWQLHSTSISHCNQQNIVVVVGRRRAMPSSCHPLLQRAGPQLHRDLLRLRRRSIICCERRRRDLRRGALRSG
jgi:hypothetical protein